MTSACAIVVGSMLVFGAATVLLAVRALGRPGAAETVCPQVYGACACGNAARYVDADGVLTCAICPLKSGRDSLRISDVPALLAWVRRLQETGRCEVRELDLIVTRR